MNFSIFKQKFKESENTKTVFGILTVLLVILAILQQIKINAQHERLVLIPPQLSQEAKIAWDSASQNYLNDFALYLVSQISSAVPTTVDYTVQAMEPFFDQSVWTVLKPQLLAVKNNPNYVGINPISHFTPSNGIIYEPETNKIFISGKLTSSAYSKGNMTSLGSINAVYELKMYMNNGMPKVSEWYAYTGEAKTLAWAAKNPTDAKKDEQLRQEIRSVPIVRDSEIEDISSNLHQDAGEVHQDTVIEAQPQTLNPVPAVPEQGVILPEGTVNSNNSEDLL